MGNKKSFDSKKPLTKKVDLKYSLMDKALGIKQVIPNSKKTINSNSFIQSLSKPVQKTKNSGSKPNIPVKDNKQKNNDNKQKKDSSGSNVVVGAVVLVVLVSLFFVLNQNLGLGQKDATADKDKSGEENEANKNNNLIPLTFEEKYSDCILESNVQVKENCLQSLAIEFNNPVLCDELVNLDSEKCSREVWKANAIISQELDSCKTLLTELDRVDCVKQIALNTSDKTFCSNLGEVVSGISITEINSCLIDLAIQEKNLTICDEI
ncbi:MAG: hypothetical protein COX63_02635, partial [Candidatus Diapherotrites archaeon CG_4_10_14_0_2_um_filter_31_5]